MSFSSNIIHNNSSIPLKSDKNVETQSMNLSDGVKGVTSMSFSDQKMSQDTTIGPLVDHDLFMDLGFEQKGMEGDGLDNVF